MSTKKHSTIYIYIHTIYINDMYSAVLAMVSGIHWGAWNGCTLG